jgi:hypothetical protein
MQNFIQHSVVKVNSICRGKYWVSSEWISMQQVNRSSILHSPNSYFIEQSPSWEATLFVVSEEIPRILWNPKVHYRIQKRPLPVHILSELDPILYHHIPLPEDLRIIVPSTHGSPSWSLSLRHPLNTPLPSPYVLHAPNISLFSTWSPAQYLVRSTHYWAPCCVVFSTPLLTRASYDQIFPPAPYSQTLSAYVPTWMWATKIHTRTKRGKIIRGGADKALAQSGRKKAIATKLGIYSTHFPRNSIHFLVRCSNFWKPLKSIQRIIRPTRSPRQQWPPWNGDLSIVFQSREQLVVRLGHAQRIGWVIRHWEPR